jgi:hypothetical protein
MDQKPLVSLLRPSHPPCADRATALHLASAPRLPFTVAYFGSIGLTLFCSFKVSLGLPNPNPCTSTMCASRAPVLVASPTLGFLVVDCSCSLMVRPRDLAPVQAPYLHLNGDTACCLGLLPGFILSHGFDRPAVCGALRRKPRRRVDARLSPGDEICLSTAVFEWLVARWCSREGRMHQTNLGLRDFSEQTHQDSKSRCIITLTSSRAVYARFAIAQRFRGHAAYADVAHLEHQIDRLCCAKARGWWVGGRTVLSSLGLFNIKVAQNTTILGFYLHQAQLLVFFRGAQCDGPSACSKLPPICSRPRIQSHGCMANALYSHTLIASSLLHRHSLHER